MLQGFNVTYDIVTPESAEHGDTAENGYAAENVTLRESIGFCGIFGRPDGSFEDAGRWWQTIDAERDYIGGSETTYAIHPPRNITRASYARVTRLLCARRTS